MSQQINLRSRNAITGDAQSQYDAATYETIRSNSAVVLDEDFTGPGHSTIPTTATTGYSWIQKTIKTGGSPTVAVVANAPGGQVKLTLDATSEKQEATLYAADELNWDLTKYASYETLAAASVLPTGNTIGVLGLHSAWIDGPLNAAAYAHFEIAAGGAVNMQTFDGTNTQTAATGVTLAAGVFHVFRIDISDPTYVRFFIDGIEYNTPRQFAFAATGALAILQPYQSVYKASGTGLGSLTFDNIQVSMNRA